MLLHDGGFKKREIARDLGLKFSYVQVIVERYSIDLGEERRLAGRVRASTQRLGEAVIAAGGHR